MIAQWRIGTLDEPGERRAASLSSRSVTDYVTRNNLVFLGVTLAAWLLLAVGVLFRSGISWAWGGQVLYTVAVLAALALSARAVINRPSGFVDPDIREADDALRGHGLTVLVGSAIALLFPPLWTFAIQTFHPVHPNDAVWTFIIPLACVLTGWHVASASRSVRAERMPQPLAEPVGR